MNDRRAAGNRILVHDRERRRRDLVRIRAKLRGDGADEKRLARAEVANEMHDGVAGERARDLAPRGRGFGFITAEIRLRHPRIVGWSYTSLPTGGCGGRNVRNGD